MYEYKQMIKKILEEGDLKEGRNGGTVSYFNYNFVHDLKNGFPLLTTKAMPWKSVLAEFLWIISGESHIRNLSKKTKIWDAFADSNGELQSPYGYFMRNYPTTHPDKTIDQLNSIIEEIKRNPKSRRLVMLSWFPQNAIASNLPPCHFAYVFNVLDDKLNLHITQRSGDLALGIPFDIAVFALMLSLVAKLTNLKPGKLAFTIVDAHIYYEHLEGIAYQMERDPFVLPELKIKDDVNLFALDEKSFELINYSCHNPIRFEMKE
jgi:thymidylate synthase